MNVSKTFIEHSAVLAIATAVGIVTGNMDTILVGVVALGLVEVLESQRVTAL